MVFRSNLSPQQALELAKTHLENVRKEGDRKLAVKQCDEADAALSRMKRSAKKDLTRSNNAEDQAVLEGIVTAYLELSNLLNSLGYGLKAQNATKKSEKWR